jgi:hypothetical protein
MRLRYFLLISLLSLFLESSYSQTHEVGGRISDLNDMKPLEYVTVRVADKSNCTTSDGDGNYFIRLNPGRHKLVFSYIGYCTDTVYVNIEDENIKRNVFLKPSDLAADSVKISGADPANEIIRKAIGYKNKFQRTLKWYEYDFYTKFILRSNRSKLAKQDTTGNVKGKKKLPISGILEATAKGYFKKPDVEKVVVTAKRETSDFARAFPFPYVVNFYAEELDFNEFSIPTPLSDNAFDYYKFRLRGTTSIDSTLVYEIEVINSSENRPLFKGTINIADSIFSIMSVDLFTNDAGKPLGIYKLNFKQKFSPFTDSKEKTMSYWMPTDAQIFAKASFAAILKFEAEINTIVSDYTVNKESSEGVFDGFLLTLLPDLYKDSVFWAENQLIKNTAEEIKTFKRIELEEERKNKSLNFNPLFLSYGRNFTTNFVDYYHFNRVEGSAVGFNLGYFDSQKRLLLNSDLIYGTSDKKSKFNLAYSQRFLRDSRLELNAAIYKRLKPLSYPVFLGITQLFNSFNALYNKLDNLDYYYVSGYNLGVGFDVFPQFVVKINYTQEDQTTANKNTDYSFRRQDEKFIDNPKINDAYQRVFGIDFTVDPNLYRSIDWKSGKVSRFKYFTYPILDFGFRFAGLDVLPSTYNYRHFWAAIRGQHYFNRFLNIKYRLGGDLMSGDVPFQSLSYYKTNSGTLDIGIGFYALGYQEFLGDKLYYLNFSNNFGKILWGGIPFMSKWNLIGFFNAGRNEISNSNYDLAAYKGFTIPNGIYMEAGFGISRIFNLLRVSFAWRLNNMVEDSNKMFINFSLDTF